MAPHGLLVSHHSSVHLQVSRRPALAKASLKIPSFFAVNRTFALRGCACQYMLGVGCAPSSIALGNLFEESEGENKLWLRNPSSSYREGTRSSEENEVIMDHASAKMPGSPSLILTSGASGRVNALLSVRLLRSLLVLLNAVLLLLLFPFQLRRRSGSATEKSLKEEKQDGSGGHHRKTGPVLRVPAAMVSRRNNSSLNKQLVGSGGQAVNTRRTLAIEGVVQDDGGSSVRKYSLFPTSRGDTLFTQSWTPVSVKVRGVVVLLHGLNEHSGRYDSFARQLNANGFKVYAMDWIGHGGSDGLHAYVHSLDHAVEDTKAYIQKVLAENPGFPCFGFGHSTGAAIILKVVLDPKVKDLLTGIVLTSPAIGVQPSHPILVLLAPVLSLLLPKYQFSAANKPGLPVCRDPEALLEKYADPLVYTGSIRVRTGAEILRICSYLQQNLRKVTVPFLVLHGTDDTVTDPEASKKLYEEASSSDKSIKLYNGLLHDLLFEPEKEAVMVDIVDWLRSKFEN